MRYNTKSFEKIQETEFCCPTCLAAELIESAQCAREFEGIELYAKADVITGVLRELLNFKVDGEFLKIGKIDIDGGEYDYCGEYLLTISDDNSIWIQEAWNTYGGNCKLYDSDAYLIFVHEDCNSKILQKLQKDKKNVVLFEIEDKNNGEFDNEDEDFEQDETVDLYDLVESMVDSILEDKFIRK